MNRIDYNQTLAESLNRNFSQMELGNTQTGITIGQKSQFGFSQLDVNKKVFVPQKFSVNKQNLAKNLIDLEPMEELQDKYKSVRMEDSIFDLTKKKSSYRKRENSDDFKAKQYQDNGIQNFGQITKNTLQSGQTFSNAKLANSAQKILDDFQMETNFSPDGIFSAQHFEVASTKDGSNSSEKGDEPVPHGYFGKMHQIFENGKLTKIDENSENFDSNVVLASHCKNRKYDNMCQHSHADCSHNHMYSEATRSRKPKTFKNAEERIQFKMSYESKKKTEMCRNWVEYGACKFGDSCSFAHGEHQLQKKKHLPSNFKTKVCQEFHEKGYCTYGERCQFLHSTYDLSKKLSYKVGLKECARLTWQRNMQIDKEQTGAEFVYINLVTGNGGGAPISRLKCFEQIYNKEQYQANRQQKQSQQQYPYFEKKSYTRAY